MCLVKGNTFCNPELKQQSQIRCSMRTQKQQKCKQFKVPLGHENRPFMLGIHIHVAVQQDNYWRKLTLDNTPSSVVTMRTVKFSASLVMASPVTSASSTREAGAAIRSFDPLIGVFNGLSIGQYGLSFSWFSWKIVMQKKLKGLASFALVWNGARQLKIASHKEFSVGLL